MNILFTTRPSTTTSDPPLCGCPMFGFLRAKTSRMLLSVYILTMTSVFDPALFTQTFGYKQRDFSKLFLSFLVLSWLLDTKTSDCSHLLKDCSLLLLHRKKCIHFCMATSFGITTGQKLRPLHLTLTTMKLMLKLELPTHSDNGIFSL